MNIANSARDFIVRLLCVPALLFAAASAHAQSYTFTTFAGTAPGGGSVDGTDGRFNSTRSVAIDSAGNLYVADDSNHTIRKITPAGVVRTLAGTAGLAGSADGTGGAARFFNPSGVATDSAGNVYVADMRNHTIRKISPGGVVMTLAGTAGVRGSTDGTGAAARFYNPQGVATDSGGNVYVGDTSNHTIRKITPAGVVTTLAGVAGVPCCAINGGVFNFPRGVAADGAGNVYVADSADNGIRKITPAGIVTTLAGAVSPGSVDGIGSVARFNFPFGMATDSAGNVYVADTNNHTIRKITPLGLVTTVAGAPGIAGSADGAASRFNLPQGVTIDSAGNIYVADRGNYEIRKITPIGLVTTLAGTVGVVAGAADGTGAAARFNGPIDVATDAGGNIYVADFVNSTIRKVTSAGVVTTLAGKAGVAGFADTGGGGASFNSPSGVTTDSAGNVYVADFNNHAIRKITPAGVVTTLAGVPIPGSVDGTGNSARFNYPSGVATDSAVNVYVADSGNHTIRKITPAGVVTTLAGTAGASGSVDGTGAAARFNLPNDVATDSAGNVYVADTNNYTIRKITTAGVVTTLAGTAGVLGTVDGTGPAASFNTPAYVATDNAGNVYVADYGNQTIRKITPAGVVTTVAGTAGLRGSADGTGVSARFNDPEGVATDAAGNLYVADYSNNTIRLGRPAIADAATIDFAIGAIGTTRLLDSSPQTATSWQWSIIHQPANSTSTLSSASVRNPLFTPDRADIFIFQLSASNAAGSSISLVNLTGTALPTTTTLASSRNPSLLGQAVTSTATVSASFGTPSGTVTFRDGAALLATLTLDATAHASFPTTLLAAGVHAITAGYNGEGDFVASTSVMLNQAVSAASASTSTITAVPTSIVANGTSSSTITVQLKDAGGVNVASGGPQVTISTTLGTLSAVTDNANGTYTAALTSTTAGTATISGTLAGIAMTSTATVTVNSSVLIAPTNLIATAISAAQVNVTWNAVANASSYQVFSSSNHASYGFVGSSMTSNFLDSGLTANTTYVYLVKAVDASNNVSPPSNIDWATTILFTDDPVVPGSTVIQAIHVTELRAAVNAVRAAAGLSSATFTNTVTGNVTIKADDVIELRSNLDAARSALGLVAVQYTDVTLTVGITPIKAAHIQELCSGVK